VLDFCDVEPNPARSKKVWLPADETAEVEFPSNTEWLAIMRQIRKRSSLAVRLIEAEGLRVAEAVNLTFGDVDFAEGRIRVSRARTKRRTAGQRWLPGARVAARRDRRSRAPRGSHPRAPGLRRLADWQIRDDLELACHDAGIASYHPHSLRHRRCSLWLAHGFETVFVKQWSGHKGLDAERHLRARRHRPGGRRVALVLARRLRRKTAPKGRRTLSRCGPVRPGRGA
jgi:integrase